MILCPSCHNYLSWVFRPRADRKGVTVIWCYTCGFVDMLPLPVMEFMLVEHLQSKEVWRQYE